MPKKNIVIVGGGFAGVNALRRLSKFKNSSFGDFRLILIDKKDNFEFLIMLPDIIGGWLGPESLNLDLRKLSKTHGCEFVKDEVTKIDFAKREVELSRNTFDYEYLLICSGSETNFFNNENARANCFKLDNVADAVRIREKILERAKQKGDINVVIVGGGYTGIEIATNINYLLKNRAKYKIYLLERAQDILMMVPEWIRKEVKRELKNLNIEIIYNDSLKEYDRKTVLLESGNKIEDAFCIWSAGVKTSSFIDKIDVEKERTRIKVKEDLRIANRFDDNVFVAGDAGYFYDNRKKSALRMAVMFSVGQGKVAAQNVIKSILNRPLSKYHPVDLGYLIPMAHGKAPGVVMDKRMHGFLGYIMHYYMCIYRSEWENKMGVIRDIFLKGTIKKEGGD